MGQTKTNKKENGISVIGTKKPLFRTFPKMFKHLRQAEGQGARESKAWTVRTKQGGRQLMGYKGHLIKL